MSKRIIILHCKHNDVHVDATDETAAFEWLFKFLDKQGFYSPARLDGEDQRDAYRMAKQGSRSAMKWILQLHSDYEYETWDYQTLIDPLTDEVK